MFPFKKIEDGELEATWDSGNPEDMDNVVYSLVSFTNTTQPAIAKKSDFFQRVAQRYQSSDFLWPTVCWWLCSEIEVRARFDRETFMATEHHHLNVLWSKSIIALETQKHDLFDASLPLFLLKVHQNAWATSVPRIVKAAACIVESSNIFNLVMVSPLVVKCMLLWPSQFFETSTLIDAQRFLLLSHRIISISDHPTKKYFLREFARMARRNYIALSFKVVTSLRTLGVLQLMTIVDAMQPNSIPLGYKWRVLAHINHWSSK